MGIRPLSSNDVSGKTKTEKENIEVELRAERLTNSVGIFYDDIIILDLNVTFDVDFAFFFLSSLVTPVKRKSFLERKYLLDLFSKPISGLTNNYLDARKCYLRIYLSIIMHIVPLSSTRSNLNLACFFFLFIASIMQIFPFIDLSFYLSETD